MALTENQKLRRRSKGATTHQEDQSNVLQASSQVSPQASSDTPLIFDAPSLIDLSSPDWQTKEEVWYEEVSETWGLELGKRSDEGRFFGLKHLLPTTETKVLESGQKYQIVTTETVFLDSSGRPSELPEDHYQSFCVSAETPKALITGNFLDRDSAELWIETQLEIMESA